DTVVAVTIDPATGQLATQECPTKKEEFYIPGTEPTEYCSKHGGENVKPPSVPPTPPAGEETPTPEAGKTPEGEANPGD
ncbi:MAG TPA: penicillin-binding protein, partial [Geobacteraceae bacterium]